MTTNKTSSSASRDPGFTNSIPFLAVKPGAPKPVRAEKAPIPQAEIEAKAYEIWMTQGQRHGQDQQHWFEAERQLRRG